jgi:hypothetical protein
MKDYPHVKHSSCQAIFQFFLGVIIHYKFRILLTIHLKCKILLYNWFIISLSNSFIYILNDFYGRILQTHGCNGLAFLFKNFICLNGSTHNKNNWSISNIWTHWFHHEHSFRKVIAIIILSWFLFSSILRIIFI